MEFFSDEIILKILNLLDLYDVTRSSLVCRRWNEIHFDETIWEQLYFKRWNQYMHLNPIITVTAKKKGWISDASYDLFKERFRDGDRLKERILEIVCDVYAPHELDFHYQGTPPATLRDRKIVFHYDHTREMFLNQLETYFPFKSLRDLSKQFTVGDLVDFLDMSVWKDATSTQRDWLLYKQFPISLQTMYLL
eukprot:TRINITY_DN8932_c0_g1_i1.p1 TRINITY_DN8932_c0_g1~~TRINITY_DN8932_c0_g1_i1.p1  ORF type:complete len:193 (-),score=21.05 TRINITY_DN8932_c0_g1_i1:31-609(-)